MTGLMFAALVAAAPAIQSAQKAVALDGDAGAKSYAMSSREPLQLQLDGPGTLPLVVRVQRAPGKASGAWKLKVVTDGKAASLAVAPGQERGGLLSAPAEIRLPVAAGRHTLLISPESGAGFVHVGELISTALALGPAGPAAPASPKAGSANADKTKASDPRLVQWEDDSAQPVDDAMLVPLQQLVPELDEAPAAKPSAAAGPPAAPKPAGPAAAAATAAVNSSRAPVAANDSRAPLAANNQRAPVAANDQRAPVAAKDSRAPVALDNQRASVPSSFVASEVPAPPLVTAMAPLDDRVRLEPYIGFGFTQDFSLGDGTPEASSSTPQLVVGADFLYRASPQLLVTATVRDHIYHRSYLTDAPGRDGGPGRLETGEHKLDLEIVASHELLHHLTHDGAPPLGGRLELEVRGGPAARFFINSQVPSSLTGLLVGGQVRFALAPALSLYGSAANIYNLNLLGSYSGPALYYGAPKSSVVLGGGVALGRTGPAQLRFGYDGEVLALERGYRQYHALTFNLDLVL